MPPAGAQSLDSNTDGDKIKPPFLQRVKIFFIKFLKSLRLFLFNGENRTICGATTSTWIKISLYYTFFYISLGLFYSGMVAIFGAIVSRDMPTYTYKNSQMNDRGSVYVGMGFRPMPDMTSTSLTVYNDSVSQNKTASSLTAYRNKFLTQYDLSKVVECSPFYPASQIPSNYACKFTWTDIVTSESHPCSTTNLYGWPVGQPCVLIKLNKIYDWVPADGDITNDMIKATNQTVLLTDLQEQNIYITCGGKDSSDQANIGNMIYYSLLHPLGIPNYGGIPYYFFPYKNAPEHVEPFVLVQFTSLSLNTKVNVICRAWAPNIVQFAEGTTRRGTVTFDILRSNSAAPKTK